MDDEKNQKNGTKMIKYDYKNEQFYILYDNEFIIMSLKDRNEQKEFESFWKNKINKCCIEIINELIDHFKVQ